MARVAKGHVEPLPSGSYRVSVYAGVDPLTRQEIRLRSTVKDERLAQIELGRLLKEASEGRTPEADATVARLLDEYAAVADWDVSTRQTNEGTGVIRHAIKELAADGLIIARHGRATVVAGAPIGLGPGRWRPDPGYDCRLAGCRPRVCRPMKPNTIRGITASCPVRLPRCSEGVD